MFRETAFYFIILEMTSRICTQVGAVLETGRTTEYWGLIFHLCHGPSWQGGGVAAMCTGVVAMSRAATRRAEEARGERERG